MSKARKTVVTKYDLFDPTGDRDWLIPAGTTLNVLEDCLEECGYLMVETQDNAISTSIYPEEIKG